MKLGACYNSYPDFAVFDCEELLETSIQSIKPNVDYVVIVYQTVSNFGNKCSPFLEYFLQDLVKQGLVDELVKYTPRSFSPKEKKNYVSAQVRAEDLGGPCETVGNQFLNEITKREIGRLKCMATGCTHFMTIDADEYYLGDQLKRAKEIIIENDYDATACRMRIFFKKPIYEYTPCDEINSVPLIYKLTKNAVFKLAHPYPAILDPTRRLENTTNFYHFEREEVEMYHMTFIRKDLKKKLENVSNKANYGKINFQELMKKWDEWVPGKPVLHPHPCIGNFFKGSRVVDNFFNIDLDRQCALCCISNNLMRCSKCKSIRYCCREHQILDWPQHKLECKGLIK